MSSVSAISRGTAAGKTRDHHHHHRATAICFDPLARTVATQLPFPARITAQDSTGIIDQQFNGPCTLSTAHVVFREDFESNDLSAWTLSEEKGNELSCRIVNLSSRHGSTRSLRLTGGVGDAKMNRNWVKVRGWMEKNFFLWSFFSKIYDFSWCVNSSPLPLRKWNSPPVKRVYVEMFLNCCRRKISFPPKKYAYKSIPPSKKLAGYQPRSRRISSNSGIIFCSH